MNINISGEVVRTSQLPKRIIGLGDYLVALNSSPLETSTVLVSDFVSFLNTQFATSLASLTDVSINTPLIGQALVFNGSHWVNQGIGELDTLDSVTTRGNTTTNSITVGGLYSPYLRLDTVATPTLQEGMFAWNDVDGTANLRLKGNNVTLQVGQETVARVVNKTGADLLESEYKVVRVRVASEGGAQGQRLAVVLAQGDNDPDSATTLGVVTENIGNNQEGFITIFGNVNGINTTGSLQGETWVDGDVLYLSPTTPGGLTKVKPQAPQHTLIVGYVVYAHQNNGKIFVKVDNGYELDELHNVLISNPNNNDILQYNSTQQVWKNIAASVAVPTPTLAQVTTAGNTTTNAITVGGLVVDTNTLVVDSVNNRLGIGTATPANTLDVNGTLRFGTTGNLIVTSTTTEINIVRQGITTFITSGSAGNAGVGTISNAAFTFFTNNGAKAQITAGGNFLIGTTTDAGFKLDVNGTARIKGNVDITTSGGTNVLLAYSSYVQSWQSFYVSQGGGTHNFAVSNASSGGNAYFNNVNVGIGTTSPSNKLDVVGNIEFGAVNVSDTWRPVLGVSSLVYPQPFLAVSNADPSMSRFNIALKTDTIPDAENTVTGFTGPQINLWNSGVSKFLAINTNGLQVSNGTSLLLQPNSGNVLIGTTTDAGYKLDVNGTAIVGDTNSYGDVFVVKTPGIGWSFDYQYLKIGVVLKLGTDRLQLRVNNNTAYVYNNGDSGNSSLTVMGGHDGAITQFAPIIFGSGRDASLVRETMRVDNQNQRVGIGTTSPTYNLEVSSTSGTGFGIMSGANSGAEINFQNRGYGIPRWTIRATGAPDGSSGGLTFQRLASTFPFSITSGDNVLIGTGTDSGYKLDVNGTVRISGTTYFGGSNNQIQQDKRGGTTSSSYLTLLQDGNNRTFTFYQRASVFGAGVDVGMEIGAGFLTLPYYQALIGASTTTSNAKLIVTGSITAASALAQGVYFNNTLVAAANNDVLVGLDIAPTFTNGAFTGVTNYALRATGRQLIKATVDGFESIKFQNFADTYSNSISFYKSNGTTQSVVLGDNGASAAYPFMTGMITSFGFVGNKNSGFHIFAGSNIAQTIFTTGNVGINTTTDSGYKLDVNGTARFNNSVIAQTVSSVAILDVGSLRLANDPNGRYIEALNGVTIRASTNPASNFFQILNNSGKLVSSGTISITPSGIGSSGGFEFTSTPSAPSSVTLTLTRARNDGVKSAIINTQDFAVSGATPVNLFIYPGKETILNNQANLILAHDGTSDRGNVAIGTSTLGTATELTLGGSQTASSAIARGQLLNTTLVAAANDDVLVGLDIAPTFTNGASTGVTNIDLRTKGTGFVIGSGVGYGAQWGYSNDGIVQVKTNGTATEMWFRPNGTPSTINDNYWAKITQETQNFKIIPGNYQNVYIRNKVISGGVYLGGSEAYNSYGIYIAGGSAANVLIGTTTDAGYKLDVNGTARVVSLNGISFLTSNEGTTGNLIAATGRNITFVEQGQINTQNGSAFTFRAYADSMQSLVQNASGRTTNFIWVKSGFSGANYANTTGVILNINPTYSLTGTNSGTLIRGIYYNPVLTDLATATHRAIETTSGDVIFNGGNVGIGTTTPVSKLNVYGGDIISSSATANRTTKLNDTGLYLSRTSDGTYPCSITGDGGMIYDARNNHTFRSDTVTLLDVGNAYQNVTIGASQTSGARLVVKGSGSTSATTAFLVQNSTGTSSLSVADNGKTYAYDSIYVGSAGAAGGLKISATNISTQYYDGLNGGLRWINNTRFILYAGTAPGYPVESLNVVTSNGGSNTSHIFGTYTDNTEVLSALVEIRSTSRGFLPPRLTTAQILAITSPAEGLQVYNTDLKTICFYNGTAWQRVTSTAM